MREEKITLLVYDLVSENTTKIKSLNLVKELRAVRIYCTRLLHSLGIQSTESVIIISKDKSEKIDEIIDKVNTMYKQFYEHYNIDLYQPTIKIIELDANEVSPFIELARNRLAIQIDEDIDKISSIFDMVKMNNNIAEIKKLKKSIKLLRKNWIRIAKIVSELKINLESEISYLLGLVDDFLNFLDMVRNE